MLKYIIIIYLLFAILEGVFVLVVNREPSKMEDALLLPFTKLLLLINKGLRELNN